MRDLLSGIERWLTPRERCVDGPAAARIFKIIRTNRGEKLAYARILTGTLAPRQRIVLVRKDGAETTSVRTSGSWRSIASTVERRFRPIAPGPVRSQSCMGSVPRASTTGSASRGCAKRPANAPFPAPSFESIGTPVDPAQANALHAALDQLAEQDPLISLRVTPDGLALSLFGEVQKEVLTETLWQDYRVVATFGPSRIICIERVIGVGDAVEIIGSPENPFAAGMGLRVEAGSLGSGIRYERELGSLPPAFYRAIEETVFEWLAQGVHGWQVTDCVVTLHSLAYWSPVTIANDFRKLAPLPLFDALHQARTIVCEPVERLEIELPVDAVSGVVNALVTSRATIEGLVGDGDLRQIACVIPTAEIRTIEQHLTRLTRGEGTWFTTPAGYQPVDGPPPERVRSGPNPLNRDFYLAEVARM